MTQNWHFERGLRVILALEAGIRLLANVVMRYLRVCLQGWNLKDLPEKAAFSQIIPKT